MVATAWLLEPLKLFRHLNSIVHHYCLLIFLVIWYDNLMLHYVCWSMFSVLLHPIIWFQSRHCGHCLRPWPAIWNLLIRQTFHYFVPTRVSCTHTQKWNMKFCISSCMAQFIVYGGGCTCGSGSGEQTLPLKINISTGDQGSREYYYTWGDFPKNSSAARKEGSQTTRNLKGEFRFLSCSTFYFNGYQFLLNSYTDTCIWIILVSFFLVPQDFLKNILTTTISFHTFMAK